MTPLVINEEVLEQIKALRELAEANPVDLLALQERMRMLPQCKEHHVAQMTRQTITIPLAFLVTFSIEHGHPCGPSRHMSMSVQRKGRVPSPAGLWLIAKELGFWGTLMECSVWEEKLCGHGQAINIVQPIKANE